MFWSQSCKPIKHGTVFFSHFQVNPMGLHWVMDSRLLLSPLLRDILGCGHRDANQICVVTPKTRHKWRIDLLQNLITWRLGGKSFRTTAMPWGHGTTIWNVVLKICSWYQEQNTNILLYNRCKRIKHLLVSKMPPVHCTRFIYFFFFNYKKLEEVDGIYWEITLQCRVSEIVSSFCRAVPFPFCRSTCPCPLGPWWDCPAPLKLGQSGGWGVPLWEMLLFWAHPIIPTEPNRRPVSDIWGH